MQVNCSSSYSCLIILIRTSVWSVSTANPCGEMSLSVSSEDFRAKALILNTDCAWSCNHAISIVETLYCTLYSRGNCIEEMLEKKLINSQKQHISLWLKEAEREERWRVFGEGLHLAFIYEVLFIVVLQYPPVCDLTLLVEALHHHGTLQRSSTYFNNQVQEKVSLFHLGFFLTLME